MRRTSFSLLGDAYVAK